jgi:hypothetical protein
VNHHIRSDSLDRRPSLDGIRQVDFGKRGVGPTGRASAAEHDEPVIAIRCHFGPVMERPQDLTSDEAGRTG